MNIDKYIYIQIYLYHIMMPKELIKTLLLYPNSKSSPVRQVMRAASLQRAGGNGSFKRPEIGKP